MTSQQAITLLRNLEQCLDDYCELNEEGKHAFNKAITALELFGKSEQLPSAQPFHNITMSDVLKYIDGMPEDVWQEFTACLECRGWELKRITAKWSGSEFA